MHLLIADDHTLFRDALVHYIQRAQPQADVTITKDFYEVEERLNDGDNYDLVMLDYKMPGMKGLEGFQSLRKKFPDLPVALMSGVAEHDIIRQAIENGARAYLPKTLSGKELLDAIHHVLNGKQYIPTDPDNDTHLMPSHYDDGLDENIAHMPLNAADNNAAIQKLSPREKEVLSFIMQGASNKEIAAQLGLQEVTIKLHVRGVCRKLDAKNRTQAAMKAQQIGFQAQI